MTPPATMNFKLRKLRAGPIVLATDATIRYPFENRCKKYCSCTRDQDDAPVQTTDRESHPTPPEGVLVSDHAEEHFRGEDSSIHATRAARQAVERQHCATRQKDQETQFDDLF